MQLVAIGDIHGCLDKLVDLIEQLQPTPEDQLVYLGDYIDRGPDSQGVIEFLLRQLTELPNTICLRGNHEQILIDAWIEEKGLSIPRLRDMSLVYAGEAYASDLEVFRLNGGFYTLKSYEVDSPCQIPGKHIEFIRSTRLWHQVENFLFVHAGATAEPIEEQDARTLLWERFAPPGRNGEVHVVGHNPTTNGLPIFEPGRISVDTGATYGKKLTAVDVLTGAYWQAG